MSKFVERAARMLRTNRFLTLATFGDQGAWAAPINYVIGPGRYLHFYSAKDSRHAMEISADDRVAFAIFDSTARSSDVDGMQVAALCQEVEHDQVHEVLQHYFQVNFTDSQDREWWYRPPSEFQNDGPSRFYQLTLIEAFVIDFESVETNRIDRRVPVEVSAIWHALGQ